MGWVYYQMKARAEKQYKSMKFGGKKWWLQKILN
jgi:hypothetical protein